MNRIIEIQEILKSVIRQKYLIQIDKVTLDDHQTFYRVACFEASDWIDSLDVASYMDDTKETMTQDHDNLVDAQNQVFETIANLSK